MEETEKELVILFKHLKDEKSALKRRLSQIEFEASVIEEKLITLLEAKGADSTADYTGIGRVQINKPRLYASCLVDNRDKLVDYCKEVGREDLLSTTIAPQTLSSFVSEQLEEGQPVPEFINYYLKPNLRVY